MFCVLHAVEVVGGEGLEALADSHLQLLLPELTELLVIHAGKTLVEDPLPYAPDLFNRIKFRATGRLMKDAEALTGDPSTISWVLMNFGVVHDDDGLAWIQRPLFDVLEELGHDFCVTRGVDEPLKLGLLARDGTEDGDREEAARVLLQSNGIGLDLLPVVDARLGPGGHRALVQVENLVALSDVVQKFEAELGLQFPFHRGCVTVGDSVLGPDELNAFSFVPVPEGAGVNV